ncbi:hypothetical protein BAE44_0016161 [Dichanthelium oligosanthes]|uniref:PHD finger protein ALFIN-LIKE n=1 Tax=Dichanthelium oligosanthes TaxID=888268 RepID=A0A1E5VCE5_9POAL|nr:hypothetical protein BAE44_0016161 [Dichanthelium oligosanthes]
MLEPVLGINFARDGMKRRYWLSLVAVHSDACSSPSPTSTPPTSTATTVSSLDWFWIGLDLVKAKRSDSEIYYVNQ